MDRLTLPNQRAADHARREIALDFFAENAAKLKAELKAAGIEPTAGNELIVASAGGWFAAMSDNVKASVIAAMRKGKDHD